MMDEGVEVSETRGLKGWGRDCRQSKLTHARRIFPSDITEVCMKSPAFIKIIIINSQSSHAFEEIG